MSDTSQGPGWWLASDGKWYPPELWTGPPASGPVSPQSAPGTYPGQVGTGSPAGSTGAPYGGQAPVPGSIPYTPYGGTLAKRNNGLAVASLACGCAGFLFIIPAILGVIFGFVARSQIRQSAGTQGGDGLAVAGIIVGFSWIALFVILIIVGAATKNNTNGVVGTTAFVVPV